MSPPHIPFNRAPIVERQMAYLEEALRQNHTSGDGPFTKRCHKLLEAALGVPKALLTTSCTHALEMSALLLDIGPGSEVIVPSFAFVSTINAFVLRGARPVFADVRMDTLNLDETALERHISRRTKAIVLVHYGGVGCEMDVILDVAGRHKISVVEDNAHGPFGRYRSRPLGTFGRLATLSFHETKNFSCGEGGALLINDPKLVERAEIIREKGTNRTSFFRGDVEKYSWVDVGSSYLPADLLAAILLAQLESREMIQKCRHRMWDRYSVGLRDWADVNQVTLPTVPPHCDQAFHLFYLLLPSSQDRERLIGLLRTKGVLSVFHYLPLHLSRMGLRYGGRPGDCPVTEDVSGRLLRLPFYVGLTEAEQGEVIEAVTGFQVESRS